MAHGLNSEPEQRAARLTGPLDTTRQLPQGEALGREQGEEALLQGPGLYRTLVEAMDDGVTVKDRDGRYLLVNSESARRIGRVKDEIIGRTDLELRSREEALAIREHDLRVLQTGEMVDNERELTGPSGSRVYYMRKVPLRSPRGEIVGVVTVSRDITERKRIEEQLRQASQADAMAHLAAQVAHRFNNLLGPMVAYPELIRRRLPHDHPATLYCDALREAAHLMAQVNEDLLMLAARELPEAEPADVNRLVEEAVSRMKDRPDTLTVEVHLAADLASALGSPRQIARIIAILIANARDAMRDIGTLRIETDNFCLDQPAGNLNVIPAGRYVRLRVSDTGAGIPPEKRSHVFEPSAASGTGAGFLFEIGLAVVQAIVTGHRGHMDVESEVGKGSTVAVCLPPG